MAKHSVRQLIAVTSAICVWLAATLQALQIWGMTGGVGTVPLQARGLNITSPTAFLLLDPQQLHDYWQWKRGQLQVDVGINLFTAAGLLGLSWCVLVLSPIFAKYKDPFGVNLLGGDGELPNLMVGMFFIGAIAPAFSLAKSLGLTQSADLLSQQDGFPDAALQSLHMAYQIFRGEGMYMFSTQFVFIPIGLCILAHLSFRTGELGNHFGVMGIVTAFFGFITFFLELGTFNLNDAIGSAVGAAFGVSLLFYGVVLLPIWTIWLGWELRRIKKLRTQPPVPKRGYVPTSPAGAVPDSGEIGGATAVTVVPTATAVSESIPSSDIPSPAAAAPTTVASSPVAVTVQSPPIAQPVVVPALAPPPQARSVAAQQAQAQLAAFAAPSPQSPSGIGGAQVSTPPFTAAPSPPSPQQHQQPLAPAGAAPSHTSHGSDLDFLSGDLSSSFVAVDHAAAAAVPPPSSSVAPPQPSFDILSSPAVPEAAAAPASSGGVMCANCNANAAVVTCAQCDGDLCSSCNDSIHATGLLKKHKRTPLGVDPLQ